MAHAPLLASESAPAKVYGAENLPQVNVHEDEPAIAVLVESSPGGADESSTLETISTVLAQGGLSGHVVNKRRAKYGWNELSNIHPPTWKMLMLKLWGPMPWLVELSALLSFILEDYKDFGFLLALLFFNGLVAFYEEFKSGNALDELKKNLARQARVYRDGEWTKVESRELVPGDIVMLRLGDVVPADCKLGTGEPVDVNQSALTGESLPVTKFEGDTVYSGSIIKRGTVLAMVSETGSKTFFGKAASMVGNIEQAGHFQVVLWHVTQFLMAFAFVLVLIIFFTEVLGAPHLPVANAIKACLVLLVASLPIAVQVVCTGTMAVGSRTLAENHALVSRLSSIEELAGMDVLCSDKTGTLTQNRPTLDTPWVFQTTSEVASIPNELSAAELERRRRRLIINGAIACQWEGEMDAIDTAITGFTKYVNIQQDVLRKWYRAKFVPFNPRAKRATAYIERIEGTPYGSEDDVEEKPVEYAERKEDSESEAAVLRWTVTKGSPQAILSLCCDTLSADERHAIKVQMNLYASRGYRTLGVARCRGFAPPYVEFDESDDPASWEFLGLIPMFDPPRHDTKATIEKAIELGIEVKMVTGDHGSIGVDTARRLGMGSNILGTQIFQEVDTFGGTNPTQFDYTDMVEHADGFAEVYPEHKLLIVDLLQKSGHIVGMTGDGVNDASALRKADVGIAVHGATDAACAAADIVLTDSGLSTILSSIILAREIFQRMKNYCIYRISATIQILVFLLLSMVMYDFKLPVFVVVLISIINDGTIITIAYDNVQTSTRPEKWNLHLVVGVALALGAVSTLGTYFMLFLALPRDSTNMDILCTNGTVMKQECVSYLQRAAAFDLPVLEIDQVQALIFLQISISGQLTVFSARTRGWFYSRSPGISLSVAFFVTQVCSTILAIYPLGELEPMIGLACSGPDGECRPPKYTIDQRSGWTYAVVVWGYCFILFLLQDLAKQVAYGILQWKDAAEVEKTALLRMQRENRLKEDEVRPRRDPASSWERARMRDRESMKHQRNRGYSTASSDLPNARRDSSQSKLSANGGVIGYGTNADFSDHLANTQLLSLAQPSANLSEVLQSLIRRVKTLEDELASYKK